MVLGPRTLAGLALPALGSEEFKAAILHHIGSTAPGASWLTYSMVKGWPDSVITKAHELLTIAFNGPTPTWLHHPRIWMDTHDVTQGCLTILGLTIYLATRKPRSRPAHG